MIIQDIILMNHIIYLPINFHHKNKDLKFKKDHLLIKIFKELYSTFLNVYLYIFLS